MWQPGTERGLNPLIKDVADVADHLVGIAAILVAGLFAYFKFFKERLYRPRLEPQISARLLAASPHRFLEVVAGVKNTGLAKVDIDLTPSCLRVFGAASLPSMMVDEPTWQHIATLDVADRHEWVEPQELLRQTWLVALPGNLEFPAYRVEFRLVGIESEWYAETVVVPGQTILAASPMEKKDAS